MLINVIIDLKQFMLFYFILCGLFSLVYSVTGNQNMQISANNLFREEFKDSEDPYPGIEYRRIGQVLGNYINIIKASTGDLGLVNGA